jgi:hypothetical protein
VLEERVELRELEAGLALGAKQFKELVAAALPVAPVAALDGWAHAQRLAADDLRRLLGTLVAVLVGVVAERNSSSSRDQRCPLPAEGASAGWEHQDRRNVADEIPQPSRVGLALDDEPVERITLAGDDRLEPGRRVLRVTLVRARVDWPVLDCDDAADIVLTGEGEFDLPAAADNDTSTERRETFDRDPLRRAEAPQPIFHLSVDRADRLELRPLRRVVDHTLR